MTSQESTAMVPTRMNKGNNNTCVRLQYGILGGEGERNCHKTEYHAEVTHDYCHCQILLCTTFKAT